MNDSHSFNDCPSIWRWLKAFSSCPWLPTNDISLRGGTRRTGKGSQQERWEGGTSSSSVATCGHLPVATSPLTYRNTQKSTFFNTECQGLLIANKMQMDSTTLQLIQVLEKTVSPGKRTLLRHCVEITQSLFKNSLFIFPVGDFNGIYVYHTSSIVHYSLISVIIFSWNFEMKKTFHGHDQSLPA